MIVRGHGRLMAAKRLGMREVPIDFQDYENEADEYADLIADNRLAELAETDNRMLLDLIEVIDHLGGGLTLTAYSEEELTQMINRMAGADDFVGEGEDDIPPPAEGEPITQPGDLWTLGPHRLLCGDATSARDVGIVMHGEQAAMIFTDPPYGVSYVSISGKFEMISGDDKTHDELIVKTLLPAFKLMVQHSTERAGFYIWHASATRREYEFAMVAAGLREIHCLIWVKPNATLSWQHWRNQTEPVFYAAKQGHKPEFYGDRTGTDAWYVTRAEKNDLAINLGRGITVLDGTGAKLVLTPNVPKNKKMRYIRLTSKDQILHISSTSEQADVWEVAIDTGYEHPNQKPVELARRAIESSSLPGQVVLDLFLGSGTTLIGAEKTKRICYGTELDPAYCDLTVRRWERFTGRKGERTTTRTKGG